MVLWEWFVLLFVFVPLFIAWIYTAIDIFRRPDEGGLTKFLWLLLILFLPIIGMLIYFIARPDDVDLVDESTETGAEHHRNVGLEIGFRTHDVHRASQGARQFGFAHCSPDVGQVAPGFAKLGPEGASGLGNERLGPVPVGCTANAAWLPFRCCASTASTSAMFRSSNARNAARYAFNCR